MSRPPHGPRPRGSLHYDKQAMSLDDLIDRLGERGLQISERDRVARYLRHIGYYRFSPYSIPFQQGRPDHVFRKGTAFDDVLGLYVFDRALRLLVLDALERVEVAVRSALTDHMSTKHEDPHWYTSDSHFRDRSSHAGLLRIVRETSERRLSGAAEPTSQPAAGDGERNPEVEDPGLLYRSALEHYLMTYETPDLPPSWLMVETLTIGQLATMIGNLRITSDRTAIARSVGVTEPVLRSWLRTYVRVRNICAHHGRLWNVGLGVYPAIPNSSRISWLRGEDALPERSRKRLYPVLVSLQTLLDTVSPRSSWARRLHDLVSTSPPINRAGMGIPQGWSDDEFWSRHIS